MRNRAPFPAPFPAAPPWPRRFPGPCLHPGPGSPASPPAAALPPAAGAGRGAAHRRLHGWGSVSKGETGVECGQPAPGAGPAMFSPSVCYSPFQARPGLHRQVPSVPHKSFRGARPASGGAGRRPATAESGSGVGGARVGEQCVPSGSGSRLLASGGIEGELVLELQQ